MQPAVTYEFVGDLLRLAEGEAASIRSSALRVENENVRAARMRIAALIEELVHYARDRDRALAQRVEECARLRLLAEAS